jgi:hypothetical protein
MKHLSQAPEKKNLRARHGGLEHNNLGRAYSTRPNLLSRRSVSRTQRALIDLLQFGEVTQHGRTIQGAVQALMASGTIHFQRIAQHPKPWAMRAFRRTIRVLRPKRL